MTNIDFSTFKMGWRPNQFFAAPADFQSSAKPMAVAPVYSVPVDALDAAFRAVALASPRVRVVSEDSSRRQIDFVQRSAVFKFPDTITVQFVPQGESHSSLVIYSRATVGIGDMGVNKKRVLAWLAALSAKIDSD
jgi:uncharacterized protein (DUF1499 family)